MRRSESFDNNGDRNKGWFKGTARLNEQIPSGSKVKVVQIIFLDDHILQYEFLPMGQTVNKEYYSKVL